MKRAHRKKPNHRPGMEKARLEWLMMCNVSMSVDIALGE